MIVTDEMVQQVLAVPGAMRMAVDLASISPLSTVEVGVLMAHIAVAVDFQHHYLSTACRHSEHGQCRQTCKFCEKACSCGCHRPEEVEG